MSITATVKDVEKWVRTALADEDIEDMQVVPMGKTDGADGYLTEVVFVHVAGKRKTDGSTAELDVVAKISKDIKMIDGLRVTERELYVYDSVLPAFRAFEKRNGAGKVFDSVPWCYKTVRDDGKDVIVMDNLRKKGYVLHDRMKPMNDRHIHAVLRAYADFHAVSFAFRDQDKTRFDELTKDMYCMHSKTIRSGFSILLSRAVEINYEIFSKYDKEIGERFKELIVKDVVEELAKVLQDVPKESVVTHGDCWNNNFMFKYQNDDRSSPKRVAIVDWQLSSLHSPAIDLGYFLIAVSSEEQVSRFDEYLRYYHDNLSRRIRELGSDPDVLFPYGTLLEHWKKYTALGFSYITSFLPTSMCDKEKAVNMEDYEDPAEMADAFFSAVPENREEVDKRLLAIARYYFKLKAS